MNKRKKILIANRSEIAIRIAASVRILGLSPVGIYSPADENALHISHMDEAHLIEQTQTTQSYLNAPAIVALAKKIGALAIHPGYGFLSEKSDFAALCEKENIIFVGPNSKTIALMGDKVEARKIAKQAHVPLIEGSDVLKDANQAKTIAQKIGFPILLKAKAGGGGKGMRTVEKLEEVASAFEMATSEAQKAFHDGSVYIEKYATEPRHVEVQIFGLKNGDIKVLGSRDCSVQRRHQKIIEEAPAPNLPEHLLQQMFEASIRLAKAVNYKNAGTLEFLVDKNHQFYFLEMNTRLQVEHPVTEWTYGVDLVLWQLCLALGLENSFSCPQHPLGHAIEVRLYAEDPDQNFFPCPGKIETLQFPNIPGVRIDTGIKEKSVVSLFYDPMIAKISTFGSSRLEAIDRMVLALKQTTLLGIKTNLQYLIEILQTPNFREGKITTSFLNDHKSLLHTEPDLETLLSVFAASFCLNQNQEMMESNPFAASSWWEAGLPK